LGILTPEEHGGIGGDLLSAAVMWEEQWVSGPDQGSAPHCPYNHINYDLNCSALGDAIWIQAQVWVDWLVFPQALLLWPWAYTMGVYHGRIPWAYTMGV
jgi:hypothetical protein